MITLPASFQPPPLSLLRRSNPAALHKPISSPAHRPLGAAAGALQSRPPICPARRRIRYGGADDEEEEQSHNPDLSLVESFSLSNRDRAFLLQATLDGEEETVLVFKGFSSLLSSGTSPDPSRSVLPGRAMVRTVDVVKGPFNPTNIEYLERGISWEDFKARLMT